jgi:hypothetical protein
MDPKLSGSLERIATIYFTYLIMKYGPRIPGFDQSIVPDILVVGGSAISAIWGWYKNRQSALITMAATVPAVRKIELSPTSPDSPALNDATPDKVTIGPTKGDSP